MRSLLPDENANADPLPLYWDSPQHAGAAPPPRGERGGGGSVFHSIFIFLGFDVNLDICYLVGFADAIRARD